MNDDELLARRFEDERDRLRGVAYRMLGSLPDADDAVQEAWLRLSRTGDDEIENLGGWLTTVVARVCLDQLRSRKSRREEPLEGEILDPAAAPSVEPAVTRDPAEERVLANSVGLALLVVLETLTPAERLAFVLHDLFAVPFEEIAPIVGRTPAAARQLASRARRRVQGTPAVDGAELARRREVVDAFLAALRGGDLQALLAVLDPDLVVRADAGLPGGPHETRGARAWAEGAMGFARLLANVQPALIGGAPGLVLAPNGKLVRVLLFEFANGKIASVDLIADPARLAGLEIAVLDPARARGGRPPGQSLNS